MKKYRQIKFYEGLSKETLVALWREQIEARELDLALNGPLFHDVFEADFDAWRFYEDGTESGSSPAAAQDTSLTARNPSTDPKVHLRARLQEVGAGSASGAPTDDYGLEYSKNSGAYAAVTASSSNVQIDTASGLTDGAATTNRATNGITDGAGVFVAGEQEAGNGVIEDLQITADNFTEPVWALKLIPGDLANGDTLDFRITLNAGAPGMTNTVVPRITISLPATFTPELDGWIFHEDGTESGAAFIPFPENFGIMRDHTIAADLQFQLRFLIQEAAGGAGAGTDDWQAGYNKNGGGDVDITGSSTAIKADTGSALTNGGVTTDRMTGGTGTFGAGGQEKANGIVEDVQVGANNHTQLLYGLTGVEAEIASGDVFKFYMKLNGVKITSNVTPEIVFNAGPVIRATESDQSGSFTNAVTLTKPTSTVENDLMAAMGYIDDNAAAGDSWSVPALTGWVTEQGSNVQSVLAGVFSRIAGASEGATFAFDAAGTISDDTGGFMARIDGHNASTPIDVSGAGNGDSTAPTGPTITTTVDNCIIVTYIAVEDSSFDADVAPPAGYTKGGENRTGSNSEAGGFWAYKVQPSAGATGTQVWSTSLAVGWNAITFAIAPEAAAAITFALASSSESAVAAAKAVTRSMTAASLSPSEVAVGLAATRVFIAASNSESTVTAVLAATRPFVLSSSSESAIAVALSKVKTLAALSSSPSSMSAVITRAVNLIAAAISESDVVAAIVETKVLAANSSSASAASIALDITRAFIASSLSESASVVALTVSSGGTTRTFIVVSASTSEIAAAAAIARAVIATSESESSTAVSWARYRGFTAAPLSPSAITAGLVASRPFVSASTSESLIAAAFGVVKSFAAASSTPSVIAAALNVSTPGSVTFTAASTSASTLAISLGRVLSFDLASSSPSTITAGISGYWYAASGIGGTWTPEGGDSGAWTPENPTAPNWTEEDAL